MINKSINYTILKYWF